MGCAFSSLPTLRPTLHKSQCCPKEAVNERPPTFPQGFHPFPRLPYELRRQIWIECLSQETPRVYGLELDIALSHEDNDTDMYMRPTDVKFAPARPLAGVDELRNLIAATATSRQIGSTCREARDATVFILPDVFEMRANPKQWPGTSQRPHILAGSFRFNAKRDVIAVLFSSIERLKYIRTWTQRGNLLPGAQIIQHVALDTSFIEDVRITGVCTECGCGKPDCVVCSRDPLLDFVRLFPNVESFHILQHSTEFVAESIGSIPEDVGPVGQCECATNGQGIKHDWPLFKGMEDDAWFISYSEDGGCSYPTLPQLAYDRGPQRSRWPYYDALRELEIRMLRRVTLTGT